MQLKPPPPKQIFNLHECDDTVAILVEEVATHSPWQKNAESPGGIGCFSWRPPANLYTKRKSISKEVDNKSKKEDELRCKRSPRKYFKMTYDKSPILSKASCLVPKTQ